MIETSVSATSKPFVARCRRTRVRAKKLVAATDPGTSVQIEKSDLIKGRYTHLEADYFALQLDGHISPEQGVSYPPAKEAGGITDTVSTVSEEG